MLPEESTLPVIGAKVERIRLEQRLLIETVYAQGALLSQIHSALHPEEPPKGESATDLLKEVIDAVKSMHDDIRELLNADSTAQKSTHST